MTDTKKLDGTPFTLNDMRLILSDEMQKLRDGDTTAANVNAINNATGKMLSSIKLEMEYFKLIGKTPNIPMLLSGESA